jgi:hypothetical protein
LNHPEDIDFLTSMKTDRLATLGAFDSKLHSKVKRKQEREARAAAQRAHATKELQEMSKTVSSAMLESESDKDSDKDEEATPTENMPLSACTRERKKNGTAAFIPPDILSRRNLVTLATRLNMTPMQQAAFTRGLIEESGGNLSNVSTSYATADRSRRKVLEAINEECHEYWTPPPMCTLHWDSKLTPTLNNVRKSEERLTAVVGDMTQLKLLGVPAY